MRFRRLKRLHRGTRAAMERESLMHLPPMCCAGSMVFKILVAFDGSDPSERGLRIALEMGKGIDATVHVIYVIKPVELPLPLPHRPPYFGRIDQAIEMVSKSIREEGAMMEKRVADIAEDYSFPVRMHKKIGDPREEILQLAKVLGADLIIVGFRGKGGLKRLLLGSVSSYVVENSRVSTLVAR